MTRDAPDETPAQPSAAARARLIGAVVFLLAGAATILAVLPASGAVTGQLVGVAGSLLTLGGLCLLAYGTEDERPLRHAPGAQHLLSVAAGAGVAQAMVVFAAMSGLLPVVAAGVGAPATGLVGGLCVCSASVVLRLRRRSSPNAARPIALAGLVVLGVGAVAANVLWLAGARLGEGPAGLGMLVAIVLTGVGELLVAVQFWSERRAAGGR